jgi:PBSX family phage terminase large subunit
MELVLHPTQKPVALDPHRFRILCCGRRWGKTTLAIDQMKARAAIANSRIAYIAPTYQQARDIAWSQLKNDCRAAAETINESRLEVKLVNGSFIILRGWESIETLRGQKFDLIVVDEVASMRNFWLNWQEVIRPTLTDTKGEALFISTPKGFNHFYDLFNLQEEDSDYKSFHYSTYDNPFIPPEEVDKARKELSADRFAQEYMADFRKTEGLVYKEFDRERHLFTEIPEGAGIREKISGVDLGFTNPCAIPDIWIDSTDTWWQVGEYYETGKTDLEVAEYLSAKRFDMVYPDPEAPAAIAEMRKRGVNVRDVIKGHDSIKNGIDRVRERLKANKYKVHTSCKNTIMEFETYSYPDAKPGRNEEEKPMDENNHMMDAIRYPVMMRAIRGGQAMVHYPSSSMPRDNLNPMNIRPGNPPELHDKPKTATTYIPRL